MYTRVYIYIYIHTCIHTCVWAGLGLEVGWNCIHRLGKCENGFALLVQVLVAFVSAARAKYLPDFTLHAERSSAAAVLSLEAYEV